MKQARWPTCTPTACTRQMQEYHMFKANLGYMKFCFKANKMPSHQRWNSDEMVSIKAAAMKLETKEGDLLWGCSCPTLQDPHPGSSRGSEQRNWWLKPMSQDCRIRLCCICVQPRLWYLVIQFHSLGFKVVNFHTIAYWVHFPEPGVVDFMYKSTCKRTLRIREKSTRTQ